MQNKRLLFVGMGKIGKRVAKHFAPHNTTFALSRRPSPPAKDPQCGLQYIQADVADLGSLRTLPAEIDAVLYCLSPDTIDDSGYKKVFVDGLGNLLTVLHNTSPRARVFFISSSSVYHQNDDAWVDEASATHPERFAGQRLVEAETNLAHSPLAHCIIRFTGIYGVTRTRMLDLVRSGQAHLSSETSPFTNRIHEDDCVGFICHLMEKAAEGASLEPLYLATDSLPIRRNAFLQGIAKLLGMQVRTGSAANSTMRGGSKQCANKRMLASGYRLRYPSYLEGYQAMIHSKQKNSS